MPEMFVNGDMPAAQEQKSVAAYSRLYLMHYLFKESLGYNIHPCIDLSAFENLRVAEVATKTGIWLSDMAKEVPPHAELHGYDPNPQGLLHARNLPMNVSLYALEFHDRPPAHLRATYDVVHVRFAQSVVEIGDPKPLISHCFHLLKPGGYLQWDEIDQCAIGDVHRDKGSTDSTQAMVDKSNFMQDSSWIQDLPDLVADIGFEVLATDRRHDAEWQRPIFMERYIMVLNDIAQVKGTPGDKSSPGAIKEVREGASAARTIQVLVAKKSVDNVDGLQLNTEAEELLSLQKVPLQRGNSYQPGKDVPLAEKLLTSNNSLSLII